MVADAEVVLAALPEADEAQDEADEVVERAGATTSPTGRKRRRSSRRKASSQPDSKHSQSLLPLRALPSTYGGTDEVIRTARMLLLPRPRLRRERPTFPTTRRFTLATSRFRSLRRNSRSSFRRMLPCELRSSSQLRAPEVQRAETTSLRSLDLRPTPSRSRQAATAPASRPRAGSATSDSSCGPMQTSA